MKRALRTALLAVAVAAPIQLHAQVVAASTFGSGDSFDVGSAYFTTGGLGEAVPFTYTGAAGFFLTQLRLAMFATSTPYTFGFSHGASMNTATLLESWTGGSATTGIVTLTSILNPALITGDTYWIFAIDGDGGWNLNDQGLTGADEFELTPHGAWQGSDERLPAYDITINKVTGTPEPASLVLFGTGAAGLAAIKVRRRRKAA